MTLLKPTDLRIGNLLYDRKFPNAVTNIYPEEITLIEMYPDHHGYKPIPLTEEWLRKFEFAKRKDKWTKSHNHAEYWFHLYASCLGIFSPGEKNLPCPTDENPENTIDMEEVMLNFAWKIKYVHQLQNLWHSITGEELISN